MSHASNWDSHNQDAEIAELRAEIDLAYRAIDRMHIGQVALAKVLDLPLPDDESQWPDYLDDGLPETAIARMRALADERAKVARVDLTRLVREMHEHLGAHINYGPPSTDIPDALRDIRIALLDEEVNEYREAALAGDLVGIADGLADLVYVAYGTAHTYGIPLDDVLVEVHRSNMTKTRNPDGGKFIKGPDFSRADVAGVIRAALAGPDTEATQ